VARTERDTCSSRSLAWGEQLFGTASRYRFWLMVEQPGAWGHDALVQSELPTLVGEALRSRGREHGVRVLLIKQRDRPRAGRRTCFVAYTGIRERRVATFTAPDAADLLSFDFAGLVSSRAAGMGKPVEEPLFLVCTHGKHDQCCAREGGPLYRALADHRNGSLWEATHVGGDRFAGNLVCFPHGLYFGRVTPGDAEAVTSAYGAGVIDLDFYRGRSCYPPAVQAAEYFVRRHFDRTGVDDLELVEYRASPYRHLTQWRTIGGAVHGVDVEVVTAPERVLTCKAAAPHRPHAFVLRAIVEH
jgi:hypothetical protein